MEHDIGQHAAVAQWAPGGSHLLQVIDTRLQMARRGWRRRIRSLLGIAVEAGPGCPYSGLACLTWGAEDEVQSSFTHQRQLGWEQGRPMKEAIAVHEMIASWSGIQAAGMAGWSGAFGVQLHAQHCDRVRCRM